MSSNTKKLSLEPYKGTRDFYPENQFYQDYIFGVWRRMAQSYGYLEYGASILEETDLYRAKSGEEIINEQTYSFKDRGEREVTIRPEMTPTVARMVAAKRKELTFPLRWFSIPNLFRYERPQRGRLREHWQLNCDIFGVDSVEADVEIISLAYDIMKAFGAKDEQFEIRINSRELINSVFKDFLHLSAEKVKDLSRVVDRMDKVSQGEFRKQVEAILAEDKNAFGLFQLIISRNNPDQLLQYIEGSEKIIEKLNSVILLLKKKGIKNVVFKPSLMRGLDYYTGIVFEMYDTNPANPRALFGGGRYDDLVGIFDVEKVSGVGFGWGDVTTRDFLQTHGLLPEYKPQIDLYICHLEGFMDAANELASDLRKQGLNVAVDLSDRQVSKQVKTADKEKIPFVLVVGEEEVNSGNYKVKNLANSLEFEADKSKIVGVIRKAT